MTSYEDFVAGKMALPVSTGIPDPVMPDHGMFPFQSVVSSWACRRGRAAIFAATGLGKSRMGAAWASNVVRSTGRDVLALAPLACARQMAREASEVGVEVTVCREEKDLRPGINVTNYERMAKFDPERFAGVLADESSILKGLDGATFREMCDRFRETPFKLALTATPAPNDWMELGQHAEFLGICKRTEMLAEFFVHDGGDTQAWRLKGHARGAFWQWVASWAALVTHPRDLGPEFDVPGYDLPPLRLHEHVIPVDQEQARAAGLLFVEEAKGLMEQRQARKASLSKRVEACVLLVKSDWSKLPSGGNDVSLEAGIRGEPPREGCRRSEPTGAPERSSEREEQDSRTNRLHAQLLQDSPREVSAPGSGQAGGVQPQASGALCDGRNLPFRNQGQGKGVLGLQPEEEKGCAASPSIRNDARSVRSIDGSSGFRVCDLRLLGYARQEDVPGDRPLPPDQRGSRNIVHELQYGDREIQGRPQAIAPSRKVSEPWVIFCGLNAEHDILEEAFGEDAFSVRGALDIDTKEERIEGFLNRERPMVISKSSVMGHGLNLQFCSRMAFVGMDNSWEQWFQAIRRIWRFGQTEPCDVHVFISEAEGAVLENVKNKDAAAKEMAEALALETRHAVRASVVGAKRTTVAYEPSVEMKLPAWLRSGP